MVALALALIPSPRVLLLDEPSLGLAPGLVESVFATVERIGRETGTAIAVVEHKVRELLAVADRVYAVKLGHVVLEGPAAELADDVARLRDVFL